MIENKYVFFDDISHTYTTEDDRELILMRKHGLAPDYTNVPLNKLEEARERGTRVHKEIERYCKGEALELSAELKAFRKMKIPVLANEYLVSDNEVVASSIDIVAQANTEGCVDLMDIKTTSTLHTEPLSWQLSIYAYLFELQNPDIKVDKLYGLHIKDGKGKMVEVSRKPSSEIARLIQCEKDNMPFTPQETTIAKTTEDKLAELKDASTLVASLKAQLKLAEDIEKTIKAAILSQMEQEAIKSLENDYIKITYVEASERESVDKDRLKEAYPAIYESFRKVSPVASNLRIKIK